MITLDLMLGKVGSHDQRRVTFNHGREGGSKLIKRYLNSPLVKYFRISITCACSMHLALFPLDEQTCTLDVASCKSFKFLLVHSHFFLL